MPKMGPADASNAHFRAYTGTVGRVHPVHVLRHPEGEPRAAIRLPEPDRAVRSACRGSPADNEGIVHVAGWVGLVCGASAIYPAMGEVLNEQFGRTVLPIGEKH